MHGQLRQVASPSHFYTSRPFITRPQQPFALALAPLANFEFPISLARTSLECGKQLVRSTQTLGKHANNTERTQAWETNPQPLSALASAPPSCSHRYCTHHTLKYKQFPEVTLFLFHHSFAAFESMEKLPVPFLTYFVHNHIFHEKGPLCSFFKCVVVFCHGQGDYESLAAVS